MPVLIPSTATIGGLGLVLLGVLLATDGLRQGSDRVLRWLVPRAGAGWTAALLGATAGLAPPTRLQATTSVGLASSGLLPTRSALLACVGASFATVVAVWASALSAERPGAFYVALLVLGASASLAQLVSERTVRGWSRVAAGWATFAIGSHLCAAGFAAWEGLPVAAPAGLPLGQGLAWWVMGVALGVGLGAGPVVAVVVGAATAGVVGPGLACAAILGAHAASGAGACLVIPDERGNGRRVAVGVALSYVIQATAGFLVLAFVPSSITFAGIQPYGPAFGIGVCTAVTWAAGSALLVALQGRMTAALDVMVDAEGGAAVRSLVLPELVRGAARTRMSRCAAATRNLARAALSGGAPDHHAQQDWEDVHALADQLESILATGTPAPGAPGQEVRAGTVVALRNLVDELMIARGEGAAQDARLAESVGSALRRVQSGLLSIVDGSLAPGAARRAELLSGELSLVERQVADLEQWTLAEAGRQLDVQLAMAARLAARAPAEHGAGRGPARGVPDGSRGRPPGSGASWRAGCPRARSGGAARPDRPLVCRGSGVRPSWLPGTHQCGWVSRGGR